MLNLPGLVLLLLLAAPGVTGTWKGSFSNNEGLKQETKTPFRLHLYFDQGGKLQGTLTILRPPRRTSPITDGTCDMGGCTFLVVDYGDENTPQVWRIWIGHGKLYGFRNRGPLTPAGTGIGTRLFAIEAMRESGR